MKVVISYRDNYIRKELIRMFTEHYPNSMTESFADPLLAAKSVYTDSADVVVLGLYGINLIPMLKKYNEDIKVIILAENNTHEDEAYTAGADGYVTMPIKQDELFSAVEGTSVVF